MEKVSIIIIIYNVEQYLKQCIDSVLAQTYENIEPVLVVGRSPEGKDDGCMQMCEEYAAKDKRIKLVTCQAAGVSDARNRGLAAATGDLIGFVDGDDYVEPQMFEHMVTLMRGYDADISVCGRFYEYVNTTLKDEPHREGPELMDGESALAMVMMGEGFFLHCWDKLYKRELWEGITFPIDSYVEDRIVVDKVLSKAGRLIYDRTPMYHYRERKGSLSKGNCMSAYNSEANHQMANFIYKNHPALDDICDNYLIYEYITSIQNAYLEGNPNPEAIRAYKKELKTLADRMGNNEFVDRRLKLKTFLALVCPQLLVWNTKRKRKNTDVELVRYP